ncbi:uncharacterized protein LOC144107538 [Amblyomma americanum]
MKWTTAPAKYLGVPLEHYKSSTELWGEITQSARRKADGWKGRDLSVFARASVCNVFLIARIWYILQFVLITRANLQKLHRVFAVFIWSSNWERTSRVNLFLPVKRGGLGLSNLFLKQVVSRFLFLRDQTDPLLRTMLQVRLGNVLPEFVGSSYPATNRAVTGFLREVVAAFRTLSAHFSTQYLSAVPRKKLYKDLLDIFIPAPLYRSFCCGGPGKDVLKRVKKMPVRPNVKSFFFKLHTGTLPVKTWLNDKGIFVPWTTDCILCKKPETIEHVFIDCWDPVFHWDILQRTLKKELPVTPYGVRFLPVESEEVPYDMFMLLGLHSIWKTRMAARHADANVRPVRENFIESAVFLRDVLRSQPQPPDWVAVMDELINMKKF